MLFYPQLYSLFVYKVSTLILHSGIFFVCGHTVNEVKFGESEILTSFILTESPLCGQVDEFLNWGGQHLSDTLGSQEGQLSAFLIQNKDKINQVYYSSNSKQDFFLFKKNGICSGQICVLLPLVCCISARANVTAEWKKNTPRRLVYEKAAGGANQTQALQLSAQTRGCLHVPLSPDVPLKTLFLHGKRQRSLTQARRESTPSGFTGSAWKQDWTDKVEPFSPCEPFCTGTLRPRHGEQRRRVCQLSLFGVCH